MRKCPVCSKPTDQFICPGCGFDHSRDYEQYPTFGFLPSHTAVPSGRSSRSDDLLHCLTCGGCSFSFRPATHELICLICGKTIVPDGFAALPAVEEEIPEPEPLPLLDLGRDLSPSDLLSLLGCEDLSPSDLLSLLGCEDISPSDLLSLLGCEDLSLTESPPKRPNGAKPRVYITKGCILCGDCVDHCPEKAISMGLDTYAVHPFFCNDCGQCIFHCPIGAIKEREDYWKDVRVWNSFR